MTRGSPLSRRTSRRPTGNAVPEDDVAVIDGGVAERRRLHDAVAGAERRDRDHLEGHRAVGHLGAHLVTAAAGRDAELHGVEAGGDGHARVVHVDGDAQIGPRAAGVLAATEAGRGDREVEAERAVAPAEGAGPVEVVVGLGEGAAALVEEPAIEEERGLFRTRLDGVAEGARGLVVTRAGGEAKRVRQVDLNVGSELVVEGLGGEGLGEGEGFVAEGIAGGRAVDRASRGERDEGGARGQANGTRARGGDDRAHRGQELRRGQRGERASRLEPREAERLVDADRLGRRQERERTGGVAPREGAGDGVPKLRDVRHDAAELRADPGAPHVGFGRARPYSRRRGRRRGGAASSTVVSPCSCPGGTVTVSVVRSPGR